MKKIAILLALSVAVGIPVMVAQAQSGAFAAHVALTVPGVLTAAEVARGLPGEVIFKGQTVSVQAANSGGARWADGAVMMAALVDTRRTAAEQALFQAYFVTKAPLAFGEQRLKPGTYGVEFAGGDFIVMDLAGHEILRVAAERDDAMKVPMPLQVTANGLSYRLYGWRSFVSFQATP